MDEITSYHGLGKLTDFMLYLLHRGSANSLWLLDVWKWRQNLFYETKDDKLCERKGE